MKVLMNGSEWFSARAGGLNRYFDSLYGALRARADVDVNAYAFGQPPVGGHSWGSLEGSTLSRAMRSRSRTKSSPFQIVDSHFALYGKRSFPGETNALRVHHFQGPWAAESAAAGGHALSVRFKFLIERAAYQRADHFVVLSKHFADLLETSYDIPTTRISVIPPGVELHRFHSEQIIAQEVRPNAVCVRRLERRMGIDVLLQAWGSVIAQLPGATLKIVGTGSYESDLKDLARKLDLGTSVSFVGIISDAELADAYSQATISVVPSLALEGFGLIALESLAAGTPPVVTDCGGLPDAVRGLDKSLIVPRGDAAALGARIVGAFQGQRPSRSECRTHAQQFSWERAAETHVHLYRELLTGQGVGDRTRAT